MDSALIQKDGRVCVRVCNLKVENFKRQKDSNLSKGD
jgi:hypothetical protein